MTSLPDWLSQRARTSPERPALICGPTRWTFAQLDEQAARAARRLHAAGVRPGDRVALLLRNTPAFVAHAHAVSRLGAVLVPLNVRLTPAELAWQLGDVRPRLFITGQADEERAAAAARQAQQPEPVLVEPLDAHSVLSGAAQRRSRKTLEDDAPEFQDRFLLDAPHSILYTSGTTGQPKGAVLTFGNHWWNAMGSALNLGLQPGDCWLACLPLFHVGGLAILLRSVIYGQPVVLHEAFDPDRVNHAIDEAGITLLSVVANMLQRMLAARGDRPYPPALRGVLLGGGPAPRDLLEACARRGLPVLLTYGLTEAASQVATLSPEDALRKPGSAGKPLLPVELRIEADGREAAAGQTGEIVIRGPSVSPGYLGRPAATAEAWRGGWFHTGDLGCVDEDGYLFVCDRRDDLIISGGENIYPSEVEAVLRSHPDVAEAGVTGVPDDRWGQVAAAFVMLQAGAGLTEAGLKAFCAERLAAFKVPARILFVDSLPRNASGKLLRRKLAEAWPGPPAAPQSDSST